MDRNELRKRLADEGISEEAFSFDQDRDDRYCVVQDKNGDWAVYFSERGNRWEESTYTTESAAYADFLARILKDQSTRLEYARTHRWNLSDFDK